MKVFLTIIISALTLFSAEMNGQRTTESNPGSIQLKNGAITGAVVDGGGGFFAFPGSINLRDNLGNQRVSIYGGESIFSIDGPLVQISASVPNASKTLMTFLNDYDSNASQHDSWNFNMSSPSQGGGSVFEFVYKFAGTSTIVASMSQTGGLSSSSDRRLKTNIETIGSALPFLMKLNATHYNRKLSLDKGEYGFIAQEVEEVLPELITIIQTEKGEQYMMNYTQIIPLLTKGLQEQQAIIEEQNDLVASLVTRIEALESDN